MSDVSIDWQRAEREYRAGIRPLRDIAADCGVSEGAIRKRAKRDDWTRNLSDRIQAKAADKVRKAEVRKAGTQERAIGAGTEKQIVEANAEIVAQADLINRKDVLMALDVSRGQMCELAELSDRNLAPDLEWLRDAAAMGKLAAGMKPDAVAKAMGLFDYIVSLAGRVKLSKEIAAAHGVYIPMQRKILKLDDEADKGQTEIDALLAKINAAA